MPQLDSSTFASQVFWILVGFILVYLFVAKMLVPRIENVLKKRDDLVNDAMEDARQLKNRAEEMERDALVDLENARAETSIAESKKIADFREQDLRKKNNLYDMFSKKSARESDLLIKSSEEVFVSVLNEMDELVSASLKSISCSRRNIS